MSTKSIQIKDFINSGVKEYSHANNVRQIPLLFDGLKPSHRKIIYGMLERGENAKEIQVERVAAQIAAMTDYHHGVGSLESTIVGMAREYAGTNNMNLLWPNGQFGSRLTDEAAAGRYIMTQFSPYFRQLFKKEDDILLKNILVDGEPIEPECYFPLLPITLVNGAEGTGSGHATYILQYNPEHVRDACLKVLSGKRLPMNALIPWFRGFTGEVEKDEDTAQITTYGRFERINTTTLRIVELPIGWYLDDYKELLRELEDSNFIKDFDDESTATGFNFLVTVPRSTTELSDEELMKKFKLIKRETENFTVWNEDGRLERLSSPEEIVERFVAWRVARYEDRRQALIEKFTEAVRFMSEKLRFILFYLDNVNAFKNKRKDDLVELLLKNKFSDYDKLLGMSMWNLTHDVIEKLKKEIGEHKAELERLKADTAGEMYKRELKEFKYDPSLGMKKENS